jgi:hypothetical protein
LSGDDIERDEVQPILSRGDDAGLVRAVERDRVGRAVGRRRGGLAAQRRADRSGRGQPGRARAGQPQQPPPRDPARHQLAPGLGAGPEIAAATLLIGSASPLIVSAWLRSV